MRDINRLMDRCDSRVKMRPPVQDICPDEYGGYGGGGSSSQRKSSRQASPNIRSAGGHS